MTTGHWGKVLRVNLTTGQISTETMDDTFMRRYVGGWGFIGYYLLKELAPGIDPLGPDNILIFTTGPLAGQPLAGGGRHMVGAKSPLTGGFAGSEAGGYFGAELKRSGWDTILFEGVSEKPVYLWVKDDQVELRSAENLWGKETLEVENLIQDELGDRHVRVAQCGIAGENLVRVSNVMHDHTRAAGRTGLGAVMGSKKLKAVVVRGTQRPPTADPETLREMGRWMRDHYMETGSASFATVGTVRMVRVNNGVGGLPTRNFQQGQFEDYEELSAETMLDTITTGRDTCYGCPIRCKWIVETKDEKYPTDPEYGGPEYETVGALGSVCGIGNRNAVARGSQLCNAYGLDSIGAGMTIAFAMECYEREIIGPEQTGGIELRFGNADAMLTLLEKIARREGFGAVLAEGSLRAAKQIGPEAVQYAMQIKGQEIAMHDPRVKYGHGLGIATSPTGADHMHSVHDSGYQTEGGIAGLQPFGILEPLPYDDISLEKARMVRYAMMWRATYNLTGICFFHPWSPAQTRDLIAAATGWNTSVMELWRAGERAYDMARAFNAREGFGPEQDKLPKRFFEAFTEGPIAGKTIGEDAFEAAMSAMYGMMGWDPSTAAPTRAKLEDLDLGWVADLLDEAE